MNHFFIISRFYSRDALFVLHIILSGTLKERTNNLTNCQTRKRTLLCALSIKTGTKRIMRLDELITFVRLFGRRTEKVRVDA